MSTYYWTKRKPSEPGMYWWRANKDRINRVVCIVRLKGLLYTEELNSWKLLDETNGEWSNVSIEEPINLTESSMG